MDKSSLRVRKPKSIRIKNSDAISEAVRAWPCLFLHTLINYVNGISIQSYPHLPMQRRWHHQICPVKSSWDLFFLRSYFHEQPIKVRLPINSGPAFIAALVVMSNLLPRTGTRTNHLDADQQSWDADPTSDQHRVSVSLLMGRQHVRPPILHWTTFFNLAPHWRNVGPIVHILRRSCWFII